MDLVSAAAPFIGAPYRLNGRTPAGWDCWGCVRWLREHLLGRASPCWSDTYGLEDTLGGGLPDKAERLIASRLNAWTVQPTPAAGHVVLLTVFDRAAHVGLMLNACDFIHAWEGVGTVMASIHDDRWSRRLRGFHDA
jgi:cell wall-associated NlpC family hydrolase